MPDPTTADERRATRPELLARNTLINLLGLGLPLAAAVVAIPPIVDGLGPERFGILGLIWVFAAWLGLLDLGLGRATTHFAAGALARGDRTGLREVVGVAVASQLLIGVIGGAAGAALAGPVVRAFLELPPGVEREAVLSFTILAAGTPIVVVGNAFRGLLEADQRFPFVNAVRVPVSVANFLLPLAAVWLGWRLPAVVVGMVAARLLALTAFAGAAVRRWPELLGRVRFDGGRLRELAGFGGWLTVSALAGALLVYADRILVAVLASVSAAGYYTVPHEVVTRLEIVPAALVLTLFPALSSLGAGADSRRAPLVYTSVEYLLMAVSPLLIGLAVVSMDILGLWVGPEFAARASLPLRILAAGMLLNALAFVPGAALQAMGRPDLPARFHLVELPLHLLLLWLLVGRWGIAGAAVAWAIRATLDAALLFGAAARTGVAPGAGWRTTRAPMLVGTLLVWAFAAGQIAGALDSAVASIAAVAAAALVWWALAWTVFLRPGERRGVLRAMGVSR